MNKFNMYEIYYNFSDWRGIYTEYVLQRDLGFLNSGKGGQKEKSTWEGFEGRTEREKC